MHVVGMVLPISNAISDSSRMFLTIPDKSLTALETGITPDVFVVRREFSYIFRFSYVFHRTERRRDTRREEGEEKEVHPMCPSLATAISLAAAHLYLVTFNSFS